MYISFLWRMSKMKNKNEKTCTICGRIITDKKNRTSLCPKCQKQGNNILAGAGAMGIFIALKKHSSKIIKGAVNIAKIIKK